MADAQNREFTDIRRRRVSFPGLILCPAIKLAAIVAVLCGAAFSPRLEAVPIVYSYVGVASGTLGGASFDNAPYEVDAYADTANVAPLSPGSGTLGVPVSQATFDIGGVGSGTFTQDLAVFLNPEFPLVTLSYSLALGGADMWDLYLPRSPADNGFNLQNPLGPVEAFTDSYIDFADVQTALGPLTFNYAPATMTFTATIVPEPSATALCCIGALAIGFLGSLQLGRHPLAKL